MPLDPQLFSIGEFSQISGLSIKTLRFYDERGLLKPALVDATSGYRYYDGASLERAHIVAQLRRLEFPLEEIARILAECGDDLDLLAHLERQRRVIEERMRADREIAGDLAKMIALEREAAQLAAAGGFAIEEKELPALLVAGVRMTGRYSEAGRGIALLGRKLGRYLTGKPHCLYHDAEYREEDASFEPCFALRTAVAAPDGIAVRTLPATRCLALVHQGPYEQLSRSYRKIFGEAKRRGLAIVRPTREIYLKGPGMIFRGNPRRYLTEIQLPYAT